MQRLYLEALRSRENEVLQFIIILASALGGFSWVVGKLADGGDGLNYTYFAIATIAILLLLTLGALHTLALSYNYRSILLQLRNVERELKVDDVVLRAWQKTNVNFRLPKY